MMNTLMYRIKRERENEMKIAEEMEREHQYINSTYPLKLTMIRSSIGVAMSEMYVEPTYELRINKTSNYMQLYELVQNTINMSEFVLYSYCERENSAIRLSEFIPPDTSTDLKNCRMGECGGNVIHIAVLTSDCFVPYLDSRVFKLDTITRAWTADHIVMVVKLVLNKVNVVVNEVPCVMTCEPPVLITGAIVAHQSVEIRSAVILKQLNGLVSRAVSTHQSRLHLYQNDQKINTSVPITVLDRGTHMSLLEEVSSGRFSEIDSTQTLSDSGLVTGDIVVCHVTDLTIRLPSVSYVSDVLHVGDPVSPDYFNDLILGSGESSSPSPLYVCIRCHGDI